MREAARAMLASVEPMSILNSPLGRAFAPATRTEGLMGQLSSLVPMGIGNLI
jgi:hypothetical protein